MAQTLPQLITATQANLRAIALHPDYIALVKSRFHSSDSIGAAQAIVTGIQADIDRQKEISTKLVQAWADVFWSGDARPRFIHDETFEKALREEND